VNWLFKLFGLLHKFLLSAISDFYISSINFLFYFLNANLLVLIMFQKLYSFFKVLSSLIVDKFQPQWLVVSLMHQLDMLKKVFSIVNALCSSFVEVHALKLVWSLDTKYCFDCHYISMSLKLIWDLNNIYILLKPPNDDNRWWTNPNYNFELRVLA